MRVVVIKEYGNYAPSGAFVLDLSERKIHDCIACWSCWLKTPGRCCFSDLDDFYAHYVNADKIILFSRVSNGFVSGSLKTLLDRSIPHYVPYVRYDSGESMHVKRYENAPEVEVYYEGEFLDAAERKTYEDYLHRVFYQFHCGKTTVMPLDCAEGLQA